MKKRIGIIFLVFAVTATAFGADFSISAGAGGILGGVFTRYTLTADGKVDGAQIKVDATQEMNQFNYGFFAFFDATYGVLRVFYQNGVNNFTETTDIPPLPGTEDSGKGWESVLGFSLLGKYPFPLNERLIVFPLLGMEYQISLIQKRTQADGWVYNRNDGLREKDKDGNAYKLMDWNSWWVNIGGGVDYVFTDNLFARCELLYNFRLMTPYEVKNLDMMKALAGDPNPKLSGLTSGPSLKIAAGWRFM
jgi:hypothetical protein